MMAAWYFPRQKVSGGLELALIEGHIGRIALGQPFFGADRLFQPAPANHRVPEHFQVQRRVRQAAVDLALGEIGQQANRDALQPVYQLLQRLSQCRE